MQIAFPPVDEYLTVAEIAETLKVNPQTVRNWIDRNEPKGIRVGARRVRVRRRDFDAFIESGGSEHDQVEPPVPASEGLAAAVQAAQQAIEAGSESDLLDALRGLAAESARLADELSGRRPAGGAKDDDRR